MLPTQDNIPFDMLRLDLWIATKMGPNKEKYPINANTGKIPLANICKADNKGHFAMSTDGDNPVGTAKSTWSCYATAIKALNENSPNIEGIGFIILPENRIICVDLDDCYNEDGSLKNYATEMVKLFDTFTERSVSKKGLHIFLKVRPEFDDLTKFIFSKEALPLNNEVVSLECFTQERYIWITGDIIDKETRPLKTLKTMTESQEKYLLNLMETMRGMRKEINDKTRAARIKVSSVSSVSSVAESKEDLSKIPFTLYDVCKIRDALSFRTYDNICADAKNNFTDSWYNCETRAMASAAIEHPEFDEQIYQVWKGWCKTLPQFNESANDEEWDKAKKQYEKGNEVTLGSLFHLAKECGFVPKDSYDWKENNIVTHCHSVQAKYDSVKPAGVISNVDDTKEFKTWLGDDIIKKAIEGTMLGEFTNILANFSSPNIPIQIPFGQATFALGCASSGERDFGPTGVGEFVIGAKRAKIRIFGTSRPMTCSTYVLIVAPAGSGKDLTGIADILEENGLTCIQDASDAGFLDTCKRSPSLGLNISEFQTILGSSTSDHRLVNLLKTIFSRYSYKKMLSERSNKIYKVEDRVIPYLSPSLLCSIQPKSLSRNLFQDNVDDGFIERFLICYYKDFQVLLKPQFVNTDRLSEILNHFKNLSGDFYIKDYQKEFNTIFETLTENNPRKTVEARFVNIYAPKFAILLQGGLKIEPSIWTRVLYLLKVFIQNYHETIGHTYEDKLDAASGARIDKMLNFIKTRCADGKPPNRRAIARDGGIPRQYNDYINTCKERGQIIENADGTFFYHDSQIIVKASENISFAPITKVEIESQPITTTTITITTTNNAASNVISSKIESTENPAFAKELEDIYDETDDEDEEEEDAFAKFKNMKEFDD